MITEFLNPKIIARTEAKGLVQDGDKPNFTSYFRWSKDHICMTRVEDNVKRETAHYRQGTLSSYTKQDERGRYTKVVRNFFGSKVDVTPVWTFFQSKNPKPDMSIFSWD